jgi:8-oxo-dGTP pyrophosphatase MutT (NUDIX family)
MLELLGGPAPFARTTFAPGHFTASAFVLSPEKDAVVLVWHKKLQIWVQPGGHVEPTDTSLLAAARREAREEIGVELANPNRAPLLDLDVHAIPARKDEPSHEHFDVRFLFLARSRALSTNDEVGGAKWVSLGGIGSFASDESVCRAVRKICGEYRALARPDDDEGRRRPL